MMTLTRCSSIGGQHWIKTHIIYLLTIGLTRSIHSAAGIVCDKVVARDGRSGLGADHRSFLSWRWWHYYSTIIMQFHNFMATRLFWDVTHFYLVFNIFFVYFYKSNLTLVQSLESAGKYFFGILHNTFVIFYWMSIHIVKILSFHISFQRRK